MNASGYKPALAQLRQSSRLAFAALAYAFMHPDRALEQQRKAVAALLDQDFVRTSPLPTLSASLLSAISTHNITLPPPAFFHAGNQSIDGLIFLVSLAKSLNAKQVFEIGTYNGLTAWTLAQNLPTATIHTLDLPTEQETALPLDVEAGDVANRSAQFPLVHESFPLNGTVVQHWGDSASFNFTPWKQSCDLVYVDGAHAEAYVDSDTANALQMVSSHGAIVWDDYWRKVNGVRSVLDRRTDLALRLVPGTRLAVWLSEGAESRLAHGSRCT